MSTKPESAISRSSLHEQGAYFGGASLGMETPISAAIASMEAVRASGRNRLSFAKKTSILSAESSFALNGWSLNDRTLSVQIQSSRRINELTTKKVAGISNSLSSGNMNS